MKKRPTIADVAREAGVARSTVSHVMNSTRQVSAQTRTAVLAAAEKLNYRPSILAQGLSRGQMPFIGVMTPTLISPYHAQLIESIEKELKNTGFYPISATVFEEADIRRFFEQLIVQGAAGIILLEGVAISDEMIQAMANELPLVVINRKVEGLESQCLLVDDFEGGYLATRYLLDLGHRQIAHITTRLNFTGAQLRREGYCHALQEAGIAVQLSLIAGGMANQTSAYQSVEYLLAQPTPFTAIFVGADNLAMGALLALYKHQRRVPDDVSVIGYDNLTISEYFVPPLTTMGQPLNAMGVAAAQTILKLIAGEIVEPPVFHVELVVRESTRRI